MASNRKSDKGFSTLEMMIAMTILVSTFVVTLLLSSSQVLSADAQASAEALVLTRGLIAEQGALSRKDFKLVVATTSTILVGSTTYARSVSVEQLDHFTKRVTATVSWPGTYLRSPSISLTSLITDFENAVGGDTCSTVFSNPQGVSGWNTPSVASSTFASLIGDSASAAYALTDIEAYRGRLYASVATTSSASVLSLGPSNPAAVITSAAGAAWANPGNAATGNGSYATASLTSGATTGLLTATNFGFSIPPRATILGIEVAIERKASSQLNAVKDSEVRLVLTGNVLGAANKAVTTSVWPTSDAYKPYGGSGDLWDEFTLAPEVVNSPGFGVAISAASSGGTGVRTASVDHIRMTVYYTKRFYILDITDPAAPTLIGGLATSTLSSGINAIAVATSSMGHYAYAATDSLLTSQLQIIDIKDPAAPYVASTFPSVAGTGMGKGAGTSIFYKGGYVFEGLTTGSGGPEFNVIDVSSPTAPVWKGGYTVGATVNAIVVKSGYAYLSTNDTGKELLVLSVKDPARPSLVASYDVLPNNGSSFGFGRALYAVGDTLYVGRSWLGNLSNAPEFSVLDVAVMPPTVAATTDMGTNTSNPMSVKGIVVRDTLAFVLLGSATSGGSLKIMQQSTGALSSVPLPGTLGAGGTALECEGNYLFAASTDSAGRGYITSMTGR